MPDLTIYMDVRPEIGLARIRADQGREVNRLDLEPLDFHEKVREGYARVMSMFPERVIRVDAEKNLETVLEQIKEILNQSLLRRV